MSAETDSRENVYHGESSSDEDDVERDFADSGGENDGREGDEGAVVAREQNEEDDGDDAEAGREEGEDDTESQDEQDVIGTIPEAIQWDASAEAETAAKAKLRTFHANFEAYETANDAVKAQARAALQNFVTTPALDLAEKDVKPALARIFFTKEALDCISPLMKWTCLHTAVARGASRNVKWMLANGADASIRDCLDRTAWDLALQENEDNESFEGPHAPHGRRVARMRVTDAFLGQEMESRQPRALVAVNRNVWQPVPIPSLQLAEAEWFSLKQQNFLEALYIVQSILKAKLKRQGHYATIKRQEVFRYLLRHFVVQQVANTPLLFREPSYVARHVASGVLSISMPYLRGRRISSVQRRQVPVKWRYCHTAITDSESRKLGAAPHVPVTLDEFCKPALDLEDLKARNTDQVLSKYLEWKRKRKSDEDKIIVVNQVWLWMMPFRNFVVTALGDAVSDIEFQDCPEMPHDDTAWTVNEDARKYRLRMRVGLYLAEIIDLLNRPQKSGFEENIFNTFEKYIAILSDGVSKYLRISITARKQKSSFFDVAEFDVDKEAEYLRNIVDIREELSMIQNVLLQQEDVWREAMRDSLSEHWRDDRFIHPKPKRTPQTAKDELFSQDYSEVWYKITRPQTQFQAWKRRISRLDEEAARVQESIKTILDLRAKHASMAEAHSAALMSAAVFGFTVITIIFTPLSFMMSLFALPMRRTQSHQVASRWDGAGGAYTTNYIGTWVAVAEIISLLVTGLLMWAAIVFLFRGKVTQSWQDWRKKEVVSFNTENPSGVGFTLGAVSTAIDAKEKGAKYDDGLLKKRKVVLDDVEKQVHSHE